MKNKEIKNIKSKEEARQEAINFQMWVSNESLSYGKLQEYYNYFEMLGKKFNLIKEFKKEGII